MRSVSTGTSIEAATLLALGWLAVGCGDPPPEFSNVCPREDVRRCDTREPACQESLHRYWACLAEREGAPMPAVQLASDRPEGLAPPLATTLAPFERELRALGLWGQGVSTTQAGSSVRVRGGEVRLHLHGPADAWVEGPELLTAAFAVADLVQGHGEAAIYGPLEDLDRGLVRDTVVSGVARFWSEVMTQALGEGTAWRLFPPQRGDPDFSALAASPTPLSAVWADASRDGYRQAVAAWQGGLTAGLEAWFAQGLEVRGAEFFERFGPVGPLPERRGEPPALPEGLELARVTTLGPRLSPLWLRRALGGLGASPDPQWRGDRLLSIRRVDREASGLLWRWELDQPAEAEALVRIATRAGWSAVALEDRAVIYDSDDDALRAELSAVAAGWLAAPWPRLGL